MGKVQQLNYDADYYYDVGVQYADSGQSEKAVYYYYRSLSLEPYNPWTMAEIGMCYYDLKLIDEAIEWFNRALSHDKGCTAAALGSFMCCVYTGNFVGAERIMPLCDPEELNAYVDSEEFEEITSAFKRSEQEKARINPFVSMDKFRESDVFRRVTEKINIGNLKGAEETLAEIKTDSSNYSEAAFLRAVIVCAEKNYEKLKEILSDMVRICPDDVRTSVVRAAVLHIEGDYKAEAEEVGKLKNMPLDDVECCARAICFFGELDMYEAANAYVEHALDMDPWNKQLRIMSALANHNLKNHDVCRSKLCDLAMLYPEDGEITCLADMTFNMPDLKIPLTSDLKKSTSDYYVPKFLEEVAALGSMKEVEREYDGDDSFYDRMTAFFASGRGEYIIKIVPAVAANRRLRPILRELMVMANVPVSLKIDCMAALLKNEKKREFAVRLSDNAVEFTKVKMPKCEEGAGVYRIARSALAFASLSQFEQKMLENLARMIQRNLTALSVEKDERINAAWLLLLTFGSEATFFADMLGVPLRKVMEKASLWSGDASEEQNEESKND